MYCFCISYLFIYTYLYKYIWVAIGSQLRDSVTPALEIGSDLMDEMRMIKPEPTLIPSGGIFNLPHHICMV